MDEIRKEILRMSYWEHFKKAKEFALIYSPEHPVRIKLEQELKFILTQLKEDNISIEEFKN